MPLKPPRAINPLDQPQVFQDALVEWFRREGRDYPWRRTEDPWAILVSEIMLQQTQIAAVLERGYYDRWMERFPHPAALAAAEEAEALRLWEGLGYYNRARNLQKAARAIVELHGGGFPRDPAAIRALPGVGRYTAGAVLSFAWDQPAPLVDGNVARVFARLFDHRAPLDTPASQRALWNWAEALLPRTRARAYNSALMELGQRICVKGMPRCQECPVAACCAARDPETLPAKRKPKETVHLTEHALFALRTRGRDRELLLEQETGSRRQGLWRLPLLSPDQAASLPVLHRSRYAITCHRVDLIVHGAPQGSAPQAQQQGQASDLTLWDGLGPRAGRRWVPVASELSGLAMPAPFRRAVDQILGGRENPA